MFIFVFYCKLLLKTTKEEKIFFLKFEFIKFPTIPFEKGLALACLAPEFTTVQWSSPQRSALQGQHSLGSNHFTHDVQDGGFLTDMLCLSSVTNHYLSSFQCQVMSIMSSYVSRTIAIQIIAICICNTIAKTFKKSTQGTFNSRVRVIY